MTVANRPPDAIALFSQGLDSILAVRLLQLQGLKIEAIKFISPFFGWEIKGREAEYCAGIGRDYGIDLSIIDLSPEYLTMLAAPVHGYGKNFNPCLDCKIMMLQKAREEARLRQVELIVTGEVIGQRPFSQRRDTMRRIEKLSGCEGMLLRPLSARLLPPVKAESDGLVDREQLCAFSGRGRRPQMALAATLGITDYPNPAGGCLLTDPGFAARVAAIYQHGIPRIEDLNILKYGRFYPLDATRGSYVVVGRHREDNQQLTAAAASDHFVLRLADLAGPSAILRGEFSELPAAAGHLRHHSRARELQNIRVNWQRGSEQGGLTI